MRPHVPNDSESFVTISNAVEVSENSLTALANNPFDDCSSDGELTDPEIPAHASISESSNPFDSVAETSPASSSIKPVNPSKVLKKTSSHSPIMFKRTDLNFLVHLGFDLSMAKNALMTRNKEDALDHLREVSRLSKIPIWESPLAVRVGTLVP